MPNAPFPTLEPFSAVDTMYSEALFSFSHVVAHKPSIYLSHCSHCVLPVDIRYRI
jgi:hypothetical protein